MAAKQERKTALFFPINTTGHIQSLLAIADALKKDLNYRTVFLIEGPTKDYIRGHGHELIELEDKFPFEVEEESVDSPNKENRAGGKKKQLTGIYKWSQLMANMQHGDNLNDVEHFKPTLKRFMIDSTIENHDATAKAIEDVNPDVILVDTFVPAAHLFENEAKRPWVRLHSGSPFIIMESANENVKRPAYNIGLELLTKEKRLKMKQEHPEQWEALTRKWNQLGVHADKFQEFMMGGIKDYYDKHGVVSYKGKSVFAIESKDLNIYLYPRALDYRQDDDLLKLGERWVGCDSLMRSVSTDESVEHEDWKRRINEASRGKDAVVFFSLGTIASGNVRLVQRYIDMFKGDNKRLYIVSKGQNGDKIQLDSENMIGANFVPQTYILQRSNVAIIHGGNNSTTECMYYGVPMVVLPAFADQNDNAQRMEDLSLGRRLDLLNCTKEQLMDALDGILSNQELALKMKQIAKEMQSRNELGRISKLIDKLANKNKLSAKELEEFNNS